MAAIANYNRQCGGNTLQAFQESSIPRGCQQQWLRECEELESRQFMMLLYGCNNVLFSGFAKIEIIPLLNWHARMPWGITAACKPCFVVHAIESEVIR